jgi:uncharacterized membrane protein
MGKSSCFQKLGDFMDAYLLLKTLHLLGVILFLGNIIVTGRWKAMADRTRDPKIIAFAQGQVSATDRVFTLGGILILAAAGAGSAAYGGFAANTPWIEWGNAFFAGSGIVWVVALLPIQTRLSRMAKGFADGSPIPEDYWRIGRWWAIFGIIATLLPLGTVVAMVLKPA